MYYTDSPTKYRSEAKGPLTGLSAAASAKSARRLATRGLADICGLRPLARFVGHAELAENGAALDY